MISSLDAATSGTLPGAATDITNILVVGAGQMGSGIAQVFAAAGRTVLLSDIDQGMLDRARNTIGTSAGKLHAKGRLTDQQAADIERNISYRQGLEGAADQGIHLAIEAASEQLDLKLGIFRELDHLLSAGAVLASNTSSIPITRIAAATSHPAHVIGMHFMNPPPMLDLVEVIPGLETAPRVTELVMALARDIGKVPVESADSPGFITNRVLMPMINEAFFCLHEHVGTAEAIDEAMRLGMKHPLGPLALADLIGLDTTLAILEVLHRDLGDDKYRPCPLLRRFVDAGRLGRKSGAGVFRYGS